MPSRPDRTGTRGDPGGHGPGAVAGVAFGLASPAGASARPASPARPDRVLDHLQYPRLTWGDLPATGDAHLRNLLQSSAVAALSTRSANGSAQLGDGYATISAGTRAATNHTNDGDAFEPDERFGNATAGDVFERRTGTIAKDGLVHLGLANVLDQNTGLLFDAVVGSFGDTLAGAGYSRGRDRERRRQRARQPDQPVGLPPHGRDLADGRERDGARRRRRTRAAAQGPNRALRRAARRPRGRPRVPEGVEGEVRRPRRGLRSRARRRVLDVRDVDAERTVQLQKALDRTDTLVGSLLSHVDLRRDAVLVVAPAKPSTNSALTIAAVHASGYEPGLMKSGTTRRAPASSASSTSRRPC